MWAIYFFRYLRYKMWQYLGTNHFYIAFSVTRFLEKLPNFFEKVTKSVAMKKDIKKYISELNLKAQNIYIEWHFEPWNIYNKLYFEPAYLGENKEKGFCKK
jgi:hypothetical protein